VASYFYVYEEYKLATDLMTEDIDVSLFPSLSLSLSFSREGGEKSQKEKLI